MAVEVPIVIKNPGIGNTVNQFKLLKDEIKAAKGALAGLEEGTEAFANQAARVGQLNDKLGDLNKAVSSVSGAPIENLTGSFFNLSSQVSSLDFKGAASSLGQFTGAARGLNFKTLTDGAKAFGSGLLDLGKVLLTSPIFLITAAVIAIGAGLFALKDKVKVIGDAFDFFGNIISLIVQDVKNFTDALGLTSFALDELAEKTKKTADDNYATLSAYYNNVLKLAKASGKDTDDIEREKLNASIKYNEQQLSELRKTLNEKGKLNDDESKQFKKLAQEIADYRTELNVIDLANQKEASDKRKKLAEEEAREIEGIRQRSEKREQEGKKTGAEIIAQGNKEVTDREAKEEQDRIDEQIKIAEDFKKKNQEFDKTEAETRAEEDARLKEHLKTSRDEDLKSSQDLAKQKQDADIYAANQTVNALQSLSDLAFQIKFNNLKKGSAEELKAAKQQFNINKGLQVAQATIQGVQAVLAAYSSGSAIPVIGAVAGPAFAVIAGIAAAANIAKIASAKFDPSGSSSGSSGSVSAPSAPSPNISTPSSSAPAFQAQSGAFNPRGNSTQGLNNTTNSNGVIKVAVLESDIRKVASKVDVFESRNTFGE